MKENFTVLQVPYIDDKVMWEHLKEYEVEKQNIQSHMKINRQMAILATIRNLQFATRRHLMSVHNMGGIRNANRIMGDLKQYVSKTMQGKEYVYYLNKEGHAMFGDDGKVVSRGKLAHALLRNEAWLHLFCPDDWQIETDIRYKKNEERRLSQM
ncbi:Uncharacterized protein BCRIVMBC126_02609 [Bacillus wiedmannii]|nr:Uncharacterized protein BCRIVMBC126_02609 [Bacillus wiedmannii]